ncbi:MAG: WYL domain-containing protein [Microbacteriaceae bacterium]|nr:WYL domain-containing protein [Microbacteriaceae bacterium]
MTGRQRPLLAGDRLTLMLTLVPYLIEKGPVSVADAAADFGVAPAEMRRGIKVIAVSGVPGDGGLYLHNDLFDIDWDALEERDEIVLLTHVAIDRSPRFTSREASALIAGLMAASGVPGVNERGEVASLVQKLAHGAVEAPAELAIAVGQVDALQARIADAVASGVQLRFDYRPLDGPVERRTVDPVRAFSSDTSWYLRGWCHTRRAERTFLFDRITDLEVTELPAAVHEPSEGGLFEPSGDDVTVTVCFDQTLTPLLGAYLDGAKVSTAACVSTAVVRVAHLHSLKRLAARMGGLLVVLDPPEARRVVAEWAAAGLARYD